MPTVGFAKLTGVGDGSQLFPQSVLRSAPEGPSASNSGRERRRWRGRGEDGGAMRRPRVAEALLQLRVARCGELEPDQAPAADERLAARVVGVRGGGQELEQLVGCTVEGGETLRVAGGGAHVPAAEGGVRGLHLL